MGVNESVSVTIGGRPCTNQWGYIDNGLPPTDGSASYSLVCRTPAGVGHDLDIQLVFQVRHSTAHPIPSARWWEVPRRVPARACRSPRSPALLLVLLPHLI